jgi:hypothetical protein
VILLFCLFWLACGTGTPAPPAPPDPHVVFEQKIEGYVAQVRGMAQGESNTPIPGTPLAVEVQQQGRQQADCADYADVLVDLLGKNGITTRLRFTTFEGTDTHTVVEYTDPFLQKWGVADPTFGVVYQDATSREVQSVEDISNDVGANNFASIGPKFVTPYGDKILRNYFMDGWLLYLNPVPAGGSGYSTSGDAHPYLHPQSINLASGVPGSYLFEFAQMGDSTTVADLILGQFSMSPVLGTQWSTDAELSIGWSFVSVPGNLAVYSVPVYWTDSASLRNPADSTTDLDASDSIPFWWTEINGATSYRLFVGTTKGARNVFDSGAMTGTSVSVPLPASTNNFARLWTLKNGQWYYQDSSFKTGTGIARVVSPANGAKLFAQGPVQIQWTSISDATVYDLYVGSAKGANDIYDSGGILATNTSVAVQAGQTYYLRLWTEKDSVWYAADSTFSTQ